MTGPRAGRAVVRAEAGIDRPVDSAHEQSGRQRLVRVCVRDGQAKLATGRYVEHQFVRGPRHERNENYLDAFRVERKGIPLYNRTSGRRG